MGAGRVIVFGNAVYGHRIAQRAGAIFNPAVDACIANAGPDGLWGGVIYSGFTGASIALHSASFDPRWASIDMLWVTFHYPFMQLGCKKMFAQVPASNSKALEFDRKLGFKEEARIADVFLDDDLLVLSMLREDCRWLKLRPRTLKEPV